MACIFHDLLAPAWELYKRRPFLFWLLSAAYANLGAYAMMQLVHHASRETLIQGIIAAIAYTVAYPIYVHMLYRLSSNDGISICEFLTQHLQFVRTSFARIFDMYQVPYLLGLIPGFSLFFWPINIYATCLWIDEEGAGSPRQLWHDAISLYSLDWLSFLIIRIAAEVPFLGVAYYVVQWPAGNLFLKGLWYALLAIADLAIIAQYIRLRDIEEQAETMVLP